MVSVRRTGAPGGSASELPAEGAKVPRSAPPVPLGFRGEWQRDAGFVEWATLSIKLEAGGSAFDWPAAGCHASLPSRPVDTTIRALFSRTQSPCHRDRP